MNPAAVWSRWSLWTFKCSKSGCIHWLERVLREPGACLLHLVAQSNMFCCGEKTHFQRQIFELRFQPVSRSEDTEAPVRSADRVDPIICTYTCFFLTPFVAIMDSSDKIFLGLFWLVWLIGWVATHLCPHHLGLCPFQDAAAGGGEEHPSWTHVGEELWQRPSPAASSATADAVWSSSDPMSCGYFWKQKVSSRG